MRTAEYRGYIQNRNVTVKVCDAAYAGKTGAELEAVRENARRVAWRIAVRTECGGWGYCLRRG